MLHVHPGVRVDESGALGRILQVERALDRTRGYLVQDGDLLLLDGAGITLVRFRDDADGSGQPAG